jgi:hypothetical protein
MQRQKRSDNRDNPNTKLVGGVAYEPTFLLDAVLLTDILIQPMYLKDTVSRCEHATVSVFKFGLWALDFGLWNLKTLPLHCW